MNSPAWQRRRRPGDERLPPTSAIWHIRLVRDAPRSEGVRPSETFAVRWPHASCAYPSVGNDRGPLSRHVPLFDIDPERERFFAGIGYAKALLQTVRDALPIAKTLYRALRIHIERVKTMAASHEKTVSLATTKAKIGAPLGKPDAANQLALGIEDHRPIEVRTSHSPTGPDIAVHVATKTIRRSGAGIDPHPAGPEMAPIDHVEHASIAVGVNRNWTT